MAKKDIRKQKGISFNVEKNLQLKAERGINFDDVIRAIDKGQLLGIFKYPDYSKRPHQEVMHLKIADYIYVVPYVVEEDGGLFLKTVYPSRKLKKMYFKEE